MDAKRIKLADGVSGNGGFNIPIRTLCVSPVNVDMCDALKSYFERFGTVTSVEIEHTDNADTHFALVEFKMADAAAAVLSLNDEHRIDGCRMQVKAADPWFQPDHILNALNDDCLRAILLYLNQKDLTNVANVCLRFNEQAKWVFSTKFKKLSFAQWNTVDEVENTLKTFGPTVQSIDIKSYYSEQRTHAMKKLPMIAQYCTSVLKELTFRNFEFENQLQMADVKFQLALSKLERLAFIDCQLADSLIELVSACVDLKILHIEWCRQNGVLSKWPEFTKLEELQLIYCQELNDDFIDDIVKTNSKLTKLSLPDRNYYQNRGSAKIVREIVQKNPNLQELEFVCNNADDADFSKTTRSLSQLKSLKVLKLDLNWESVAPLCTVLAGMAPIEHLKLGLGSIDTNLIEAISKMKHLKILELSCVNGLTDEHLIVLAKGLGSQLEKLRLVHSADNLTTIGLKKMLPFATKLSLLTLGITTITIDADDYKAMLATIRKRQEKNSLLIELIGNGSQVIVDETVLVENRDIFYIDEK